MHEIVLPDDVKQALEWVNGRVLQKVSPTPRHSLAQGTFLRALASWAEARGAGFVGPECRFQIGPPGDVRRTLVPDAAFIAFDRVSFDEIEHGSALTTAPDVVVEIRSPRDRQRDIDEKVRIYLAAGTTAVFLVDPDKRSLTVIDASGTHDVTSATITHEALPGFSLERAALFEMPRPRKA